MLKRATCLALFLVITAGISSTSAAVKDEVDLPKGQSLPVPEIFRSAWSLGPQMITTDLVFEEDFEAGGPAWTISGDSLTWEIGAPTSGPGGGYSSTNCAATDLSDNYPNGANEWLISPSIDLPELTNPQATLTLKIWEWFQTESGYDRGKVYIATDGGTLWTELSDRSGSSDWRETSIDLSSYADQAIMLGFNLTSDGSATYPGWFVDDVRIELIEPDPLEAVMISLDHQSFPFIYMNVAVYVDGQGYSLLEQDDFEVYENNILQTIYFEVTPPDVGGGVRLADIVFLMDNSGSMQAEINAISNNVTDFVNNLTASGVDFALGLCRFGASESSGYPIIEDNGILTSNAEYFKNDVWSRNVIDGGFEPGWDALYSSANSFSFRPGAQKIFILITDETVTGDGNMGNQSQNDAITILQSNSITTFALVEVDDTNAQTDYCPIAEQTNGLCMDIYSPFDEILEFITTYVSSTYLVRYRSSNPQFDGVLRQVEVRVSYLNLIDSAYGSYVPGSAPSIRRTDETIALHNQGWAEGTEFTIEAEVIDDAAPYVEGATLFYRTTGTTFFTPAAMTRVAGSIYRGIIPGSAVVGPGHDYYITATDGVSTSSDPSVDPATNPYQLAVLPNEAPVIVHFPVTTSPANTPVQIDAQITDDTNELAVTRLYYRKTGQLIYQSADMSGAGGNNFSATIPDSMVTDEGIQYYIFALDNFGLGNSSGSRDYPHYIYIGVATADIYVMWHGNYVEDAVVYADRGSGFEVVGMTGSGGSPVTVPSLSIGNTLRAKKKVHTQLAVKPGHEVVDNTMCEVWVHSDAMNYDGTYRSYEITYIGNVYTLTLAHPVFKYNMVVSIEWDGAADDWYAQMREGYKSASKYIYNVTDGQVMLGKVAIYDGKNHWNDCDVQIFPQEWPKANVNGIEDAGSLFWSSGKIYMGRDWGGRNPDESTYYTTIIHEFGHYGFALYDEYINGNGQNDPWKQYRQAHPQECPTNYGFMDSQYNITEMSSFNDYPQIYPENVPKNQITEQFDERRMPCWKWVQQKLNGYYSDVIITTAPYGWYPNGYIYDRLGPDEDWVRDSTQVFDMRNADTMMASNSGHATFKSSVRTTIGGKPVAAAHVYAVDGSERMFLGKTNEGGYLTWPGAYTGSDIVVYKTLGGRMLKETVHVTEPLSIYQVELDTKQPKQGEQLLAPDPGVVVGVSFSSTATTATLNLSLLADVALSDAPDVTVYYGGTSEAVTFIQVGSTNEYTGSVTIDATTPGFDGTGYLDITTTDIYAAQVTFTSSFKFYPITTSQLNRVELRGFMMSVEEDNFQSDEMGIAMASITLPFSSSGQTLYPVTEMFTVTFENTNSFSDAAGINLIYESAEVVDYDESSLGLYRWNTSSQQWDLLQDSQVDIENNIVSGSYSATGTYAVFALNYSSDYSAPGSVQDLGASTGQVHAGIDLTWMAPGDDGYVGRAANYIIRYNEVVIDDANWDESQDVRNEPTPSDSGTVETMTITMSDPNHLYYFAIRTEDEAGNLSDLSNIASATSGTESYTFSLLSPEFNDTLETLTPRLEWEELSGDTTVTYTLWYGEDDLFETRTEITNINQPVYQFTDSLRINSVYYWKITAYTASNDTVSCNQSYFRLMTEQTTPTTGNELTNENIYLYPNPFNPEEGVGTIRYSLRNEGNITIKIYDVSGKLVRTLIDNIPKTAETELSERWDGKSGEGQVVANGVYFYVIQSSSGERAVGKAAVLR